MPPKPSAEDLSIEELRRLLVEKRRASRQERLDRFRRTGRVVIVAPDAEGAPLESLRASFSPEVEESPWKENAHPRRKRILDGLLLIVEILAVIGLLSVMFNGVSLIRELNREVVSALEQPTLTPTPAIRAVVLPSGHTPPDAEGKTEFNNAEVPDHLRSLVQSLATIPIPTPGPEQAIRIQIPALDVDAFVVQGDGWEQLKKGVGQHIGTANPGEKGNVVLSAHNDVYGEYFRYLDRLKPGDQVILYTQQHTYTYIVTGSKIVEPTQVEVMDRTSQPTATLISCYPYLVDNKRIVVVARLQSGGR